MRGLYARNQTGAGSGRPPRRHGGARSALRRSCAAASWPVWEWNSAASDGRPSWPRRCALALFAAVYFGGRERDFANELARVREQMRRQTIELASLNQAFAILTGADTTVTTFGEGNRSPRARSSSSPSQGVLLIASNLQPAPRRQGLRDVDH